MNINRSIFLSSLLFFAAVTAYPQLFADTTADQFPNDKPDPAALRYAETPQPYSWQDLSAMALWASMIEDSAARQVAPYMFRIADAVKALQNAADLPTDTRERGEYVLTFMHAKYLTRYIENQTRLDTLLNNGTFNCVSSAVFYMILAAAVNLETAGVNTKDHAFITLNVNGTLVDVETTNKYGFDPGTKKEFHDEFGNVTGYAYADPSNYANRSPLSQIELVSIILNNRISYLLKQNGEEAAIPLMANTVAFLSKRTVKTNSPYFFDQSENLHSCLFNIAGRFVTAGKNDEAIRYAKYLETRYPGDPKLTEIKDAAVNNTIANLFRQNRYDEAQHYLEAHKNDVSAARYQALFAQIAASDISRRVSSMKTFADAQALLNLLEDPAATAVLNPKQVSDARNAILNNAAIFLSKEQGLSAAISFTEQNLNKYGQNTMLEQNLSAFRHNRGIELHSEFARLWNSGKRDEAAAYLQNALKELPADRNLLNDLRIVQQVQSKQRR